MNNVIDEDRRGYFRGLLEEAYIHEADVIIRHDMVAAFEAGWRAGYDIGHLDGRESLSPLPRGEVNWNDVYQG